MNEVEIHAIAAGGAGVGRLADGLIVFVPRTAPGDRVVIEIVDKRKRWATGRVTSVLQNGADRIDAECPHYNGDKCGGCQLQHISGDAQRRIKGRIVGDALRRIARRECEDPIVEPSNDNWHYRRKITLHQDANTRIGLHRYDDPTGVFDLNECAITDKRLMQLWRGVAAHRDLLPNDFDRLVLTIGRDGRRHMVISTRDQWTAEPLAAVIGDADVCFWRVQGSKHLTQVAGPDTDISPLSFQQANEEVADRIRRRAIESFDDDGGGIAWDLYGGFGDTARLLAARGYKVWTVDKDPNVRRWAEHAGDNSNVNWVSDLAEKAVEVLPTPDVVIVNPPRTGMPSRLCEILEEWGGGRVDARLGYISCDPATLARDIARMPAFRLTGVAAFDLFPQTSHVETVVTLQSGMRQ